MWQWWGVPARERARFLHMLGGLDRPDSGKVLVEGRDIFRLKDDRLAVFRRRKIGFIFQSYNLVPSLNVWENIVLPIGLDGRKVDREYVMDIVRKIGMADRLHALPGTLSGGQQQRVAIARSAWPHARPSSWPMSLPATWTPGRRSRW